MSKQLISSKYYKQIPELSEISAPFSLSQIQQQQHRRDLETEFELMRAITETKKHKMGLRSSTVFQNKKNRYPEQAIFQHSRVLLEHKKNNNDYINANIYTFQAISQDGIKQISVFLAQAPIEATIQDFTDMIVENNIECVVMLGNYIENNKARCCEYMNHERWEQKSYNEIGLNTPGQIQRRQICIHSDTGNKNIEHYLFKGWPDKDVPNNPESLALILQQCLKFDRILVHCSAGLGRSGVFVALLQILNNTNTKISIFETVRKIREHRFGAVQNNQQYQFIYNFLTQHKNQT